MYKHYFARLIIYIGAPKKKNRKKRENRETDKKRKWINYLVGIVLIVSCIVAAIACSVAAITYIVPLLSYVFHSDQSQAENPTTSLARYKERITKHNLPSAPDPFIGRNNEVKQIMTLLKWNEIDIISINGPPAFGKSALAIHVGHSALRSGMDVFYIDVSESHHFFEEKKSTKISLVGQGANIDNALADIVRSFTTSTLLILDDIDSMLVDASEKKNFHKIIIRIREIASQGNFKFKILMTSQIHITFLDRFQQILINGLDPGAAVQLLNKLVHVNESMSSKLVKLVGYCPLTIKVVAALLRKPGMEGGAWLLSKLERSGISSSCLDHTLAVNECWKAVMDIAYSRLGGKGKECGYFVSCFPGSFDEFAAEDIVSTKYDCQSRLVDASLLKRYTHMNNEMVRYIMHNLIKEYFRKKDYPKSNIQKQFSVFFQHHYMNLVLNMSYSVLQAEPSSILDYFRIESHNWKELVTRNIIRYGERGTDKLLLSIAFLHYKNLLPSNVSWLNILNIYNTYRFSIVCERFSQTVCSEILLDTVKNIHEARPSLSCSILMLIENVTEEKKISELICYCNTLINIIYYFVSMPYNALIGVSVIHIAISTFNRIGVSNIRFTMFTFISRIGVSFIYINTIFTFINLFSEMYYKIKILLCNYILLSVILLYFFIHPVSTLLCHVEWYIEGHLKLFIIVYFSLNICIFILYQRNKISTNKLYHNPYLNIFFSCGSPFFSYVIEKISPGEYYKHFWWAGCVFFSVYLYSLLEIKESNNIIKCLYNNFWSSDENVSIINILCITTLFSFIYIFLFSEHKTIVDSYIYAFCPFLQWK